jgi:NOL1/NOP2/fmu family ribosome biogenesis protein
MVSIPEKKIKRAVRIWPHLARGEGHFIALLVKGAHTGINQPFTHIKTLDTKKHPKRIRLTNSNKFYKEFESSFLNFSSIDDRILITGTYIYRQPPGLPDLTGLKVIHPGWWLGTLHPDRFSPSHAFAMGLRADQVKQVLNLYSGDQETSKYLHGESLASAGADGWLLVAVDGFPLGWGKRVQNVVKNYYPRGLRQS